MSIDKKTIDNVAHLARLEFQEEQRAEMEQDITRMLSFVEKLNELNTEGIEPLIYMNEDTNILRADEVGHMVSQAEALKNAPVKDSDYFKTNKVIDQK